MATFYVQIDAKIYGPMDGAKLKQLAAAGKVTRDALLSNDGKTGWVKAGGVKGLFPPAELIIGNPVESIPAVVRPPLLSAHEAAPPTLHQVVINQPAPAQIGNGMAMAGLVLSLIAVTFSWMPCVGMLMIPVGLLGLVFSVAGVIFAAYRGGRGMIVGGIGAGLGALAIIVAIVMQQLAAARLEETLKEMQAQQQKAVEAQKNDQIEDATE